METSKLFVISKKGVLVRRVENLNQIISDSKGELVPNNSFYRRRIKSGDLQLVNNTKDKE